MLDFIANHTGIIGMLIFGSIFCGALFMVLKPGAREKFEAFGKIPLQEEENNGK